MARRLAPRRLAPLLATIAALSALSALAAAQPAAAATVVNGDFEAGSLRGWQVHRAVEAGNWFAYEGTQTPFSAKRGNHRVQVPPQGRFAAITDEVAGETLVLYQDVALEPGRPHFLNLLAYYDSARPLAVPSPETLSVDEEVIGEQANQQFRVDVVKPSAPLETLAAGDVLHTVLRTQPGVPRNMAATPFGADLSAFAGQTVRIRAVVVANQELLNAGIDSVSISAAAEPPGRNRLKLGRVRTNRRAGIVIVAVDVPGPGLLSARTKPRWAVRRVARKVSKGGTLRIKLRPTARGKRALAKRKRLRAAPTFVYEPAAGEREQASLGVVFRLAARRKQR